MPLYQVQTVESWKIIINDLFQSLICDLIVYRHKARYTLSMICWHITCMLYVGYVHW